jgi:dihydroxyacetone kinase-like protein
MGLNWADAFAALSRTFDAQADRLNGLDSVLGDGDHGTGMRTAFAQAAAKMAPLATAAPSDQLAAAAKALMAAGGSSGALFGTLFLRMASAMRGVQPITPSDWATAWEAGLAGVQARGGAKPGDKTMVDALAPAVAAFRAAVNLGADGPTAAARSAQAAHVGADATVNMVAAHGRARFAGERGLGTPDAGAVSVALMMDTLAGCWKGTTDGEA